MESAQRMHGGRGRQDERKACAVVPRVPVARAPRHGRAAALRVCQVRARSDKRQRGETERERERESRMPHVED